MQRGNLGVKYLFATETIFSLSGALLDDVQTYVAPGTRLGLGVADTLDVFLLNRVPADPYSAIYGTLHERHPIQFLDEELLWGKSLMYRIALVASKNPDLIRNFELQRQALRNLSASAQMLDVKGSPQGAAAIVLAYYGQGYTLAKEQSGEYIQRGWENNARLRAKHISRTVQEAKERDQPIEAMIVDVELSGLLRSYLEPEHFFSYTRESRNVNSRKKRKANEIKSNDKKD